MKASGVLMKFAAHPLVVAVALGLLDPSVLNTGLREGPPSTIPEDDSQAPATPSEEDFARVELEWQSVRELI